MPVAIYILVACVITAATVLTLRETRGVSLRDVDAADARKHGLDPAVAAPTGR